MARIHLTGGVRMDGPGGSFADADLPGNQGRVAFVAIALERRPISHSELADIVWGGRLPERWKGSLAAIVSKLRSLVTSTGLDGRQVVSSASGAYALALPPGSWVDLEDALRRLDRGEGSLRHGDATSAARDATVASSILRRPFLSGVDSYWVDERRRWLADAHYRSLVALAAAWIQLGDHQLAATVAESAIVVDPYREVGHRLLITAERARGDGGAALRAFDRCEQLLRDELDVRPSPETTTTIAGLRPHGSR